MVFKENSHQKVSIHRVPENGTVISVQVRCPDSYIDVGVGDTCYLYEGDLLRIRSIQNPFEYRVVRVDNYKERSSTTTNDDFEVDGVEEKNGRNDRIEFSSGNKISVGCLRFDLW